MSNEISGIFSILSDRPSYPSVPIPPPPRWPSLSGGPVGRSFWTKYCLLCTVCGSAATILAAIFLVVAALFRYYTTSIHYFETVPTYIPAVLLSICGVSTIAFSCKRHRNIILLRITACWSLCSAALASVIAITTSLIHMNRLQTLKECVYNRNPPGCTCFSHVFVGIGPGALEPAQYTFENTPDCEVIHGILYSCLRAVFAISVVAVLLSIFLCMLLYQLIGHERKKAYWSRIRRINSDWSTDFIACLARPNPRDRSSILPLMLSPSGTSMSVGSGTAHPGGNHLIAGWGPPPPYEEVASDEERPFFRPPFVHQPQQPHQRLRLVTSASEHSFAARRTHANHGLISPHPFSPTITSLDPVTIFRQQQEISQSYSDHRLCSSSSGVTFDLPEGATFSSITSLSIPSETLMSASTTNGSLAGTAGRLNGESSTTIAVGEAPLAGEEETLTDFSSHEDDPHGGGQGTLRTLLEGGGHGEFTEDGEEGKGSGSGFLKHGSLSKIVSLPCSPLLSSLGGRRRLWSSPFRRKSVQNLGEYEKLLQGGGGRTKWTSGEEPLELIKDGGMKT